MSDVLIINQRTHWTAEGTEPDESQQDWVPRQRPPSGWFDWFFYSTYKDIEALALFLQRFGVSREFGPGQFEMAGENGARVASVGTLNLPVVLFAQGETEQAHIASRVVVPSGVSTIVKVVWSTPASVGGQNAYLELKYKATQKGEARDGALNSKVVIAADSVVAYGQNETWFDLGALPQGAALDLFLVVDGTQGSHTITSDVCVHQMIIDPEPEV
jgi:hypothetical protein